ncbi:hypothetical protein Mpsy_1486 [Methanolobus psychrophilus R15]|nr:hypothetical protein Mpsy_1486 [Methanolobus psychrophilus R15]
MTKLTTTVVVALMIMALTIMSASAATSVEVRSSVLTGPDTLDATNFAGFYYDLDDNISTETMEITAISTRTIAAGALKYNTTIAAVDYASSNLNITGSPKYNVMGLFAEKYIPLDSTTPDKLSKLLLDTSDKYTLRTGTALQLPEGYALTAKQIDVEGNKVWMEFTKDGEFVEDEILDVSGGKAVWTYEADDIAGEDDVIVMKVAVTNVFQGQVDSLAVIEGVWLMDYENVMEIETDDTFDKLEVVTVGPGLSMENSNAITLTRDKTISIAQGMSFKVADDSAVRFYVMKVFTEPGTYDIRGQVASGTGSQTWTAVNFAGFYYDLDDDISTESMEITGISIRTIAAGALKYNTTIAAVDYASSNLNTTSNPKYNVMGLFAEKYIPLDSTTPDKLSKLLLDSSDKYTLRTGTALQLPEGYALTAKQIDVEGNKVWMEFTKDGEFVEDEILDVSNGTVVWTYEADDIAGEDDVIVMKVAVTNVFQGQVDSLAVIEGVWLMDYENVMEIETDDTFDKLEVVTVGPGLSMENSNAITLTRDKTISIAQGMSFKVADDSAVRFYVMKVFTEPGTYDIRGQVASGTGSQTWTAVNFAGFYYDLDDDISTESMEITGISIRTIAAGALKYNTTIAAVDYASSNLNTTSNPKYNVMGLFAEKYIPLDSTTPDKLSKLLLDSSDKYTLRTGTALQLPEGYALTAKQIDVEGNKVWMEFTKDGEFVEDEILDVSNGTVVWTYEADDIAGEDDVIVMKVAVTNVFQGQVDSLAVVEGVWLMDYENVMEIETDDTFDKLEVVTVGPGLSMENSNAITLTRDKVISIAQGMNFKVADDSNLRYYPFATLTIEGDGVTQPETPVDETPVDNGNETPVDETPVDETPVDETPGNETPVETPEEESPGFEAIFAIAGLLAVAYLVRRN